MSQNDVSQTQETEQPPALRLSDVDFDMVKVNAVLQWTCRMREHAAIHLLPFRFFILLMWVLVLLMSIYKYFIEIPSDSNFIFLLFPLVSFFLLFLVAAIEQKTVYNYSISTERGACESYHYFPNWAGVFFKSIAVFVLLGFVGVAIISGSLLPLLGAGALGLGYAGRLLGWENKIHVELCLPWNEYSFVTLDRHRKIIVCHRTDITLGFEFRCQTKKRFEEVLACMEVLLRPDVEYLERNWDADKCYDE